MPDSTDPEQSLVETVTDTAAAPAPQDGNDLDRDARRWRRDVLFPTAIGLIGALVGIGFGLLGTFLTLGHDSRQHEADVRRDAYVALIESAEEYIGIGQITAVGDGGFKSREVIEADLRLWRELMVAKARVDIVGSGEQVEHVYQMQMQLHDLRGLIQTGATVEQWNREADDVARPLSRFRLQARDESKSGSGESTGLLLNGIVAAVAFAVAALLLREAVRTRRTYRRLRRERLSRES